MRGRARSRSSEAVLALAADLALGEPRRAHPVRWMGRYLEAGRRLLNGSGDGASRRRGAGLALVAAGVGGAAGLAGLAERFGVRAVRGALLSLFVSARELAAAGGRVRRALEDEDLQEARRSLGRDLVGRPTAGLSASAVASAAIESLAENFADGVVGPLFWHRVAGLPGAAAYRFLNTADAVLGYRTPELEAFGWAAARGDDAASLLPARGAALLLAPAVGVVGGDPGRALRVAVRDASAPSGPNAGWPMAAMAGGLGVRLEKEGHYVLNAEGRPPGPRDMARAEAAVLAATGMAVLAGFGPDLLRRSAAGRRRSR